MDPIRTYLTDGTVPADLKEGDCVRQRSNLFIFEREHYTKDPLPGSSYIA